jgi:hypothetical protein
LSETVQESCLLMVGDNVRSTKQYVMREKISLPKRQFSFGK